MERKEYTIAAINGGEPFTLPDDTMGDWDAYMDAKLTFLKEHEDMLDGGAKAHVLMLAEREGNMAFLLHVLQRIDESVTMRTIKDELTREQVNTLINNLMPEEAADEVDEKNGSGD